MQDVIGVGAGETSNKGSMSTVSKAEKDYLGMPEVSSQAHSIEDGSELELGLGLGLGVGGAKVKPCAWRDYCRILAAKDFTTFVSSSPDTGGVAGSTARVAVAGTKRAAESESVAQEIGSNIPR